MPNPVIEHINRSDVTYDLKDVGAERSENKVTAFQATPDDAHYPSEKLVSDSLAAQSTALSQKEASANKVTAFQNSPDHSHYPSEKLVYDNLESLRTAIDNIDISTTEVVEELPAVADANENINYLLQTEDGLVYYRLVDGEFVMVGAAAMDTYTTDELDAMFSADRQRLTTAEGTISSHTASITEMEAEITSLGGNTVTNVTGNSSALTVSFKDGGTSTVDIHDSSDKVTDVNSTSTGIEIVYASGDTKPITISGGGGGSAAGGSVTITRVTDSTVTYVSGSSCPISYRFAAEDSSGDTVGAGAATWFVGNVRKATSVANQGLNTFDIADYLTVGMNNVKLSIAVDTGGETLSVITKSWTVNLVNMYLTWNYDDTTINTADTFTLRWTPYGDLLKTSYIEIDGTVVETSQTTRSGVQQYVTLNKLSHGSHKVRIYCKATVGSTEITSNAVLHDMIFADAQSMIPVIGCSLSATSMEQYDTLPIPIVVYTPGSMTSTVILSVDGSAVATWTNVDRTVHTWNYSPSTSGNKTLTITTGSVAKTIPLTVTPVSIDNEEVGGYSFKLKASDITGNEALRAWTSNGITASFSNNFDWSNGGIQTETDENGNLRQYICVKAGTRMTINHKLFADDATVNGKTFKMVFKTENCRDYDASVADCYSDYGGVGIGLKLMAHEALCRSSGTEVSTKYGESQYIELEFDIYPAPKAENDGNFRYIMTWINGVITAARVYNASDNFTQNSEDQHNIVIGSDDCDVYVYLVKAYPTYLTRENHIENFIADAPNAQEMLRRFNRNNILDTLGDIDYEKLAEKNPDCRVWLYDIPRLTQGKKDKVSGCQFQQIWTNGDPYYQLTGTGTMTIQGTSSVDYLRGAANTDIDFSEGELRDGNGNNLLDNSLAVKGFKINDDSLPITYSNTKVNFASCEQVNNMCNAEWYQQFQPYQRKTKRDCMEFAMGVQFIHDQSGDLFEDDNKFHMYSIANMGTSKKNVHIFHDAENENEVCIEVHNNLNDQCRMISDDLTNEDWSGDYYFETRYPSTKNPSSAIRNGWQRFLTWMATNNPNAATNAPLAEPVTYGVYTFRGHSEEGTQVLKDTTVTQYAGTYTNDTFNYRIAKMLNECEDYMIMDSVVYHFCMLERHTMVDNVAKNSFWSSRDLLHWDLSKAYDMDTADGNNNEGQMVFDYGNEATDVIGSKTVFNAADSVWFVFISNLYEACQTMFINRESAAATIDGVLVYGAWNKDAYHAYLTRQQQKVPERVWNQCYWYDYLRTYEQGINSDWIKFLDGGQKIQQRWHYETFQEAYESSKYRGIACTSKNVTLRGYTPTTWSGVEPRSQVSIKMYNKCYIVIRIDQIYKSVKAQKGQTYTIDFSDVGTLNDTVINFYTAQMIQEIGDLSPLYPGFCSFAMASRLRSVQVGSDVTGYRNTNLESVAFDNNPMLEYLYLQNLPNANSGLDLTKCKALKVLDATGSAFTGYDFATGGMLQEVHIESPVSLTLRDLQYLTDANFNVTNYNSLTTLRLENCPGLNSMAMVNAAVNLNRARILGIDWETYYTAILNRLARMIGIDDNGYNTTHSVLAGEVDVTGPIRLRELESYEIWDDLTVNYDVSKLIPQYEVRYVNADGTLLYTDYVDRGGTLIDPVVLEYIETPTLASTSQYDFTYAGWDDLTGTVTGTRTVTATYSQAVRSYTIRWYGNVGDTIPLYSVTKVYGAEAVYAGEWPTNTVGESAQIYRLFKGWDKSTGSIKGDMNVYALWEESNGLPAAGTDISAMTPVDIYGVCAAQQAESYFDLKDHFDLTLGNDFNFTNVQSEVLLQNRFFDGTSGYATDIQLFNENAPSFTLAIDYEFLSNNIGGAVLFSCCDDYDPDLGFRLYYSNNPILSWYGSTTLAMNSRSIRNMLVLRHIQGTPNLIAYSFNGLGSSTVYADTLMISERYGGVVPNLQRVLSFGGIKTTTDSTSFDNMGRGWIHWCKIWYDDLGDDVCQKLAAWPHDTLRMEYAGSNRHQLANSSGYANASFISNNLLSLYRIMNAYSDEDHGWDEMNLRTFMNENLYKGFPDLWKSAIKQVRTRGLRASNSSAIAVSRDYLFLPTAADVGVNSTTEPYSNELTYGVGAISYFTTNTSRIKSALVIEDRDNTVPGKQYIVQETEPTLLSRYTIAEGDIWAPSETSSFRYIYISAETAAKHTQIGVFDLTQTSTTIGTYVYQASDGGLWLLASNWWTKTPYNYENWTTDYFIFVSPNGNTQTGSENTDSGIDVCFDV